MHNEDAASSDRGEVFFGSGVGYFAVIEAASFIFNPDGEVMVIAFGFYKDLFAQVGTIAVEDGVVDSFGKAKQHIVVYLPVKGMLTSQPIDERFDEANILGI